MPIYEYECAKCGLTEEVFQKISDKPLTRCHKCSGNLRKLISNSAFHLKGSGWYVTDYAKKSGAKSKTETTASAKESTPSSTADKTPTPSDSK